MEPYHFDAGALLRIAAKLGNASCNVRIVQKNPYKMQYIPLATFMGVSYCM